MEMLTTIEQNNSVNSPSKIKELLLQISNTHVESNKISHQLEKNETRIFELTKELTILKEEYNNEKVNLETKAEEASKHNIVLQNLLKDKENLYENLKTLEKKYETIKCTKPSLKDLQLMENGKRKHHLFKEFTGVRWDYSAPESLIEGFITNKKDFLHKFSYKSDVDYKLIKDSMWKNIEQSIINSTSRENYKENKAIHNCIK